MRTLSQQIRGLSKVATALGTVAITAAVFAMQRMIRTQLEVIDATTKMARSLGFTTEQMVGLQRAAGIAGVEQKELATSLRRLSKNISDANNGLTTAIRAFDSLHLSAKNLIDLSPHKALLLVADAMSKMQNPTERTRVALDLFGRSGVKMIELMKDGAAGLEAFQREAEAAGLTFSDFAGQRVEAANDAILRLKETFTAIVRKMTIDFAPSIERAAKTLQVMAPQIAAVAVATVKWTAIILTMVAAFKLASVAMVIFQSLSGPAGWAVLAASAAIAAVAIVKVRGAFDDAAIAAESLNTTIRKTSSANDAIAERVGVLTRRIQLAEQAVASIQGLVDRGVKLTEKFQHLLDANTQSLVNLRIELGQLKAVLIADEVEELAQAIRDQTDAIGKSAIALEFERLATEGASAAQIEMLMGLERELELRQKLQKGVALANRLIEQSLTPLQRNIKSQDLLKEAFERGLITEEKYNRALQQLAKDFNEATNEADRLRKSLEEVGDASVAPSSSKRTGDFRQVDSIRRLGLQNVRSRADQNIDRILERFEEKVDRHLQTLENRFFNEGIMLIAG